MTSLLYLRPFHLYAKQSILLTYKNGVLSSLFGHYENISVQHRNIYAREMKSAPLIIKVSIVSKVLQMVNYGTCYKSECYEVP